MSILFCDLVGSTELGSSLDTEVLRGVMADYWGRARSVVERHGGTVEKFIGDAVFAVFGVPTLHEDDALRAVRAGADLLVAVRELNEDLVERLGVELAVRIGVNTGEVFTGSGGEALVSADAANVAARLEQAAGAGEVLLGETTHGLVRDAVDDERVPPLLVKGKPERLVAFRLVGVRPTSAGPVRGRRFAGRLVGRQRQLQLAELAYATAVEESACVLLTVVGVPGVGKSRLVEELLAGIGEQAVLLTGRCLSYGEGITYWPTVAMLNRLVELDPRTLSGWLDGVGHADQIRAGLDTMLGVVQAATGKEIGWAFRRLVETVAADRPVVLVVDDVQWAEPALLDLLDHLTEMSRGAPILLVAMARPEFLETRPAWGAQRTRSFTTVLSPLAPTDCAELTAGLLGRKVGDRLLEQIATAADGIPLFVEEMLAMLVDQGQLEPDPTGGWRAASDMTAVTVPATVHALLAARLDRLPLALREVLDAASVVGKTFYPDAIAVLLEHRLDLEESVQGLVQADLICGAVTDFPGHDAHTFTHLLTRDTAYQALPKARRAVLHEATARWLTAEAADGTATDVATFHLEQAASYAIELGQPNPALADEVARLLLAAADRALALGDPGSAVRLVGRAERLAPTPSRLQAEIALTGSTATHQAGDHQSAHQKADQAEHIGADLNDDALVWRGRLQNASIRFWTDPSMQVDDIFALTAQAIDTLNQTGDDLGLAMAYDVRGGARAALGQLRAAAADARQGLPHAHRTGRTGPVRRLLDWVMIPGKYGEQSLADMRQQLEEITAEYGNDPAMAQTIADLRCFQLAYHGHLGEAMTKMRERSELALDRGSLTEAAAWLSEGVAWCQQWSGDPGGAADTMATADALTEGVGETGIRSSLLAELALVLAQLGRDAEAQTALSQSRAITHDNDRINQILDAATEGLLLAHQGDSEGSEWQFIEGLRIANLTEFLPLTGWFWFARSLARGSLGDTVGGLTAARAALACFQRKGFVPLIRTAEGRIAELTD